MPQTDFLAQLVSQQRDSSPNQPQEDLIAKARAQPPCRGFTRALTQQPYGFIAEMKKASPSVGLLRKNYVPADLASSYQQNGAACLSVLTNALFHGEAAHLQQAREAVELPVLRKDFILNSYQVYETRCLGADAMLLIVACLTQQELSEFHQLGRELGMDVLVEVHNEDELQIALGAGASLIGINNRNLRTFEVRLETSERLLPLIEGDRIAVAESGIKTAADIERLAKCGAHAFLVGETLMKAADPGQALAELKGSLA